MKELSKPMIDPPSLEKDVSNNENNRQNFLSLINKVIFQKWHTKITLIINKEFFFFFFYRNCFNRLKCWHELYTRRTNTFKVL